MPVDRIPGLNRMIVVDGNTFPGRIEELPLDGHTVILAENGSGKTSVIQLIPVFYGEVMNSVISSHERDNFIKHYLPRDSSYLAFEYFNHISELCSVVMHSDPSKERIQYRFIRGGLSADMFRIANDDGSIVFVTNQSFEARLRDLGLTYSSRLLTSTKSYRGIIQGRLDDDTDGKDRAYYRQLSNTYGMAPGRAPLVGVEKLLTQMLRNNVSMKSLLGAVARQATGDGVTTFKLLGDKSRDQIISWPKTFKAYRKVMASESKARELSAFSMAASAFKEELIARYNAIFTLEISVAKTIEDLEALIAQKIADRSGAETSYDERIRANMDEIQSLSAKISSLSRQMDAILARDKDLRAKQAHEASAAVARIPEMRDALSQAEAREAALSEKGGSISMRFEDAKSSAQKDALERIQTLKDWEAREIKNHSDDIEGIRIETARQIEGIQQDHRELESEIRQKLEAFTESLTALVVSKANIIPSQEMRDQHDAVKSALEAATAAFDQASLEATKALQDYKDSDRALVDARRDVQTAERILSEARASQARVSEECTPKEGTVLSHLRRHVPGWNDTIGKVIRADILQKTGLNPTFIEGGLDLYGLSLDLDRLDIPEFADDSIIEARLQKVTLEADAAERALAECEAVYQKAASARTKAEKIKDTKDAVLLVAKNKFASAQSNMDLAKDQMKDHIETLGQGLSLDIDRIKTAIEDLKASRKTSEVNLDQRLAALKASSTAHISEKKADLAAVERQAAESIQSIEAKRDEAIARLDEDLRASLASEGIDAAAVALAAAEVKTLKEDIRKANLLRSLAEDWERHEVDLSILPQIEADLKTSEYQMSVAKTQNETLKSERKNALEALKIEMDAAQRSKEASIGVHQRLKAKLLSKPGFIDPVADTLGYVQEGAEINISQVSSLEMKLTEEMTRIKNSVRVISGIFRGCGDVGIAGYLDGKNLPADFGLEWVPHILAWYNGEHAAYKENLMTGIVAVSQPIITAYQDLKGANDAIRRISRKLSEAIGKNAGFPHVKEVNLSVRFDADQQDFWPLLDRFQTAYHSWKNNQSGTPSDEMVDALEVFLNHWENKGDPVIHIDDMIYLEGSLLERGNLRKFSKNTNLGDLSSNGNIIVLRLIIFTALLSVMKRGTPAKLVWAVDEIGALDVENTKSLLRMLSGNDITLLTAAPTLDRRVKPEFNHQMRIASKAMMRIAPDARPGIREWLADDQLGYPDTSSDSDKDALQ